VEYRVNRAVAIMALAMLSSFSLAAQTVVPGLLPKDARSMGMGGSFKVFAEGYSSLWGQSCGARSQGFAHGCGQRNLGLCTAHTAQY